MAISRLAIKWDDGLLYEVVAAPRDISSCSICDLKNDCADGSVGLLKMICTSYDIDADSFYTWKKA